VSRRDSNSSSVIKLESTPAGVAPQVHQHFFAGFIEVDPSPWKRLSSNSSNSSSVIHQKETRHLGALARWLIIYSGARYREVG